MHNNDVGFNYLDFVNKLEKCVEESPKDRGAKDKEIATKDSKKYNDYEQKSIDLVLAKIRADVVSKGIKV